MNTEEEGPFTSTGTWTGNHADQCMPSGSPSAVLSGENSDTDDSFSISNEKETGEGLSGLARTSSVASKTGHFRKRKHTLESDPTNKTTSGEAVSGNDDVSQQSFRKNTQSAPVNVSRNIGSQDPVGSNTSSAKRVKAITTAEEVNAVFFKRTENLFGMYEFGIAKFVDSKWHVFKIKGEMVPQNSVAELIYIRKLPKGLNVCLRSADNDEDGYYAAVLAETVSRICNNTRVRVVAVGIGIRRTVPVSNIRILGDQLQVFIKLYPDCFVPIVRGSTIHGCINVEPVRCWSGTPPPLLPSNSDSNGEVGICRGEIAKCKEESHAGNNTDEATGATVSKRVCRKFCHFSSVLVKQDAENRVVEKLETEVSGTLVARETLTTYLGSARASPSANST